MNTDNLLTSPLVKAAGDLFMRLGIKSVSMDDIAREMGVSKKTVYQEVDNKESLLKLVLEADFLEDQRTLAENREQSHDAIDEFLRNSRYFIRQMRAISPTTLHDLQKYYPTIWRDIFQEHQQFFGQSIATNLERGMEEGLYRDDLEPLTIATFYGGMMFMVVDRQTFPAQDRALGEIISQLTRYHFHGIANQFGRERLDHYLNQEALE